MKMVIYTRHLVSTFMLILLCALGTCQIEGEDDTSAYEDKFPHLPDFNQNNNITESPKSALDILDPGFSPTSKPSEKGEATSAVVPTQTPTTQEPLPTADYKYEDIDGNVCLRLCLKAKFEIPYTALGPDGMELPKTAEVPFSDFKVKIGGDCDSGKKPGEAQILNVQWGPFLDREAAYSFKMKFSKTRSGDTDDWLAEDLEFTYNTEDTTYFEDAADPGKVTVRVDSKAEFFETPYRSAYTCQADDSIELSSSDKMHTSVLKIDEIRLQPFMKPKNNGTFSEEEPCESDKQKKPTSNVASIAVGATLGCLILIVIIIYAVGRRMGSITDRTGYKAVE
ncbi:lysosome-associated membrane glycoprotein 5-like [Amphiura filiformis]|uniref:lysosome-associated membrane glycoprotein 5-like n=1 Tax=Amphiura filiformis TaxID=82378 RepID=UPI003B2112B4